MLIEDEGAFGGDVGVEMKVLYAAEEGFCLGGSSPRGDYN